MALTTPFSICAWLCLHYLAMENKIIGTQQETCEKRSGSMKIVISVLGRDRVGIIAMVSTVLAENGVNILNLDQTILDGFFNMIMTADMAEAKISLKDLQEILRSKGEALGLEIRAQHADIFQVMHRV
jgi:ACT domain-containing protein